MDKILKSYHTEMTKNVDEEWEKVLFSISEFLYYDTCQTMV